MLIECEGAPRDLGIDQGRACSEALRDLVARSGLRVRRQLVLPRRLAGGAVLGTGAGLATLRHYPHLAERITGIARGAGLPLDVVFELMLLATYGSDPASLGGAGLSAAVRADGRATIASSVACPVAPGARPVVRQSRPEVGFHSVEITLPWLASALAGVNDHGLAVSFVPAEAPVISPTSPTRTAPPNVLLVQECLQRFDGIEAALEWCLGRPSRGRATLLLAHASGETAAVELADEERRVVRHESGTLVAASSSRAAACLRKQLDDAPRLEAGALAKTLDAAVGELVLDPANAKLCYRRAGSRGGATAVLEAPREFYPPGC